MADSAVRRCHGDGVVCAQAAPVGRPGPSAIGPGRHPSPRWRLGRRNHGGGAEQDGDPDSLQAAPGSAGQQGSRATLGGCRPSELDCCPAAAAWARSEPRWVPGRSAAAGQPGRGLLEPWGEPGESGRAAAGRGRRVVGAALAPQPLRPFASALVVLRLRRQEPELGQHHLRGLSVHRLLRRPPVLGRAPQLHQVRAARQWLEPTRGYVVWEQGGSRLESSVTAEGSPRV